MAVPLLHEAPKLKKSFCLNADLYPLSIQKLKKKVYNLHVDLRPLPADVLAVRLQVHPNLAEVRRHRFQFGTCEQS